MRFADRASAVWASALRVLLGLYWLYFAQQKWSGVDSFRPLLQDAWRVNPVPGLRQVLELLVSPNWRLFLEAQTAGETLVGVLLIAGLATRWAAALAALLAVNLALTVAFELPDLGFRWMYYLAVAASLQVLFSGAGSLALDRVRGVPRWLRLEPA